MWYIVINNDCGYGNFGRYGYLQKFQEGVYGEVIGEGIGVFFQLRVC